MGKFVERKLIGTVVVHRISPIKTLREAIENKEWFKGIVLSVTYFEHFGLLKLKEHFEGKIDIGKLKHLGVERMLILLYGSDLIDSNIYTKMMKIRKKRNDLVHGSWTQHIKLDSHDAEGLIEQAIECLEILGAP